MAHEVSRPDLYVDTAAGLLAYELSPETLVLLLDSLFDDAGTRPAPPAVIVLSRPDKLVPEPEAFDAVAVDS